MFLTFCANVGDVSLAEAEKKGLSTTRRYTCAECKALDEAGCCRYGSTTGLALRAPHTHRGRRA